MPARAERHRLPSSTEHGLRAPLLDWGGLAGLFGWVRGARQPLRDWVAVTALVAWLRRVMREPSLPRMSEQWLLSHQTEFNRDHDGLEVLSNGQASSVRTIRPPSIAFCEICTHVMLVVITVSSAAHGR